MLVVQVLRDSPSKNFFPTNCSSQESEGFFYRRATYKGRKYKKLGSRGVRQGWSVTEKKRKEKDQGRWSVATRKGREKEEKKKTKEGEKVAPQRQGSVCPQPRISFLVHKYLGSERPVLFEVSAPTRLSL